MAGYNSFIARHFHERQMFLEEEIKANTVKREKLEYSLKELKRRFAIILEEDLKNYLSDESELKAAMADGKPVTDAHANHVRVVRAVLQNAANESACSSDTLRWLEQFGFFIPLAELKPGDIMHEVFQDWDFDE